MKSRIRIRTFAPMQDRAEPIRPVQIEPLPADQDTLVTIATAISRFMGKVEIALFIGIGLYFVPKIYTGFQMWGLLPW